MPRVLIAGCGFVGLATARVLLAEGWEVIGATHSAESAAQLKGAGFRIVTCDIGDRASVAALSDLRDLDAIVHCASSGRGGADAYRHVYLAGARHLHEELSPRRLLFTSSTSVYAQTTGEWVTEENPAEPDRETGQILRATEDFVLKQGGTVARLAGIYGPGRSVLLKKFFSGEAVIEGDGTRAINQVHRDDIASALWTLLRAEARGMFNVNDDRPLPQREIYAGLAARFSRPLPSSGPIDPNRKRGWTDKRVSNARLRQLGWQPRYPSFFDAVANDPALLAGFENHEGHEEHEGGK